MSLTIVSWSLIGAFAGAAGGLFSAYPRDLLKPVIIGALAGAVIFGGANFVMDNENILDGIKHIFVTEAQQPLSQPETLAIFAPVQPNGPAA